jgi:hypothetical protein
MDPSIGKVLYGVLVISLLGDLISISIIGFNSSSSPIAELMLIMIVVGIVILTYDVRREARQGLGREEAEE